MAKRSANLIPELYKYSYYTSNASLVVPIPTTQDFLTLFNCQLYLPELKFRGQNCLNSRNLLLMVTLVGNIQLTGYIIGGGQRPVRRRVFFVRHDAFTQTLITRRHAGTCPVTLALMRFTECKLHSHHFSLLVRMLCFFF